MRIVRKNVLGTVPQKEITEQRRNESSDVSALVSLNMQRCKKILEADSVCSSSQVRSSCCQSACLNAPQSGGAHCPPPGGNSIDGKGCERFHEDVSDSGSVVSWTSCILGSSESDTEPCSSETETFEKSQIDNLNKKLFEAALIF